MPKKEAYDNAVQLAVEKLRTRDFNVVCKNLGLQQPKSERLCMRAFGADIEMGLADFNITFAGTGEQLKISDRILILHYLLCDYPVKFNDQMISFRELSGGQFYWGPFRARSVNPLEKRFAQDLDGLRKNLDRFDWEPVAIGDLAARIHVMGNLYVTLIFRLGDEELPAAADLLFDSAVKRIYNAEDAAVLSGRICLGLL